MEIQNAIIESTSLGYEGHGIMTCFLYLKYGGSSAQGFGGYNLKGEFGMKFIEEVLKIVGVDSWEKLPGKYIRVKYEGKWNSPITAIGNMLEDNWFNPKDLK